MGLFIYCSLSLESWFGFTSTEFSCPSLFTGFLQNENCRFKVREELKVGGLLPYPGAKIQGQEEVIKTVKCLIEVQNC